MARFGKVSGNVKGKLNFLDQCTFAQGAGGIGGPQVPKDSTIWYVDGSKADPAASGEGKTWDGAFLTIGEAIAAAGRMDIIYVAAKDITDFTGDPSSYEENITIPATHDGLAIIGVSRGLTQGGLPQLKDGDNTTQHILRVRAPGCLIANLGFNGAGNTGGGILFDDDYSTKCAFGTTIYGCHFKNCKGSTATDARTGAAIEWSSTGNSWQILISGCHFYKNVCDVLLPGTSNTVPQDVVIEHCYMSGPAASVDCNLYLAGAGSGINGLIINDCIFPALPAIGSGSVVRYMYLTGCVGMITNCRFGSVTSATGTTITFKASGTGAEVPTTMDLSANYGLTGAAGETSEISNA